MIITGSGFVPLDTQVLFGGFMADPPDVSSDGTTLTAVVPATGLSGLVMVVAPGRQRGQRQRFPRAAGAWAGRHPA